MAAWSAGQEVGVGLTLGGVLAALRARWLVVLLAVVLGGGLGVGAALVAPKAYVATATVLLRWTGPGAGVAEPSNVRYVTSRTSTYALLTEQAVVLEDAIRRSGLDLTVGEARNRVESEAPSGSQIIKIHGWYGNPQDAARLADATAIALAHEISREEVGSPFQPGNLDAVVAVVAAHPRTAATPRIGLYLVAGTVAGVVVGVLGALVLTYLAMRGQPRPPLDIPTAPPTTRRVTGAHVVWALLIAATIPWRNDTFYEGGADPVVLAKAAISVAALGISLWVFRRTPHRHPLPAAPVLLLLAYLAVTVIGGLANQDVVASAVVAVRVVILITSICFLAAAYGPTYLLRALVHVLGALALLGALSGLTNFSGRLGGLLPPLNPNLLAILTSIVFIWLLARILAGRDRAWEFFAVGGCLTVVFLTGSRTSLAALVVAALIMMFRVTAIRGRTIVLISASLPVLAYLILGTDMLSSVFNRGGGAQVATLSNRTIAWEAALSMDRDVWQTWFGQGLAQKKITVPGQYWDTQLLDSSWISALVQGGNLGLALVVVFALATLLGAAFSSRSKGSVWLGLAVFTILGGFLESGLFDGTVQFMVFLVTALGAFGSYVMEIGLDRRAVEAMAPRAVRDQLAAS